MVICERALIERRLEDFYAEFKSLLDNELDVEAAMMFRLAKKIKGKHSNTSRMIKILSFLLFYNF